MGSCPLCQGSGKAIWVTRDSLGEPVPRIDVCPACLGKT